MPDPAAPFSLGDGPDACLLLHGLTGAPSELRPVGEALATAGIRAVAPLLPGHGTRVEDLACVDRNAILRAAQLALIELGEARRIFVVGLSMGALIALRLAAAGDGPRIHALALLAPAVRFAGTTWLFTQVAGRLPRLPFAVIVDKGPRDIQAPQALATVDDRAARHPDDAYRSVPLGWGRELRLLSDEALALAPGVTAPTLLLHGALDRTASPRSVRVLASSLGSNEIALRVYPNSGHVLPLDLDGAAVSRAVLEFFQRREG